MNYSIRIFNIDPYYSNSNVNLKHEDQRHSFILIIQLVWCTSLDPLIFSEEF